MNGCITNLDEKQMLNEHKATLKSSLKDYSFENAIRNQIIYLDTLLHDLDLIYYFINNYDKLKDDFYFKSFEIPRKTISCVIQNNNKIRLLESQDESLCGTVKERHYIESQFRNDIKYLTTYHIQKVNDLFNIYRKLILDKKITIKKCKNCANYFITENRTDEVYCNRISPQNLNKTCKEYGAKKTYRDEIKSIPLKYEHNKTSQFYRMRINRSKSEKEKLIYKKAFDKYKKEYQNKKSKYKLGKLNENEFIEWIKCQKNNI